MKFTLHAVRKSFPDECWIWQGLMTTNGYGMINIGGTTRRVHRVFYESLVGAIPKVVLDHLCRKKLCMNPRHLEVVTIQTNTLRGIGLAAMNARKSKCIRNHPFHGRNLMIRRTKGRGYRDCRTCQNMRHRRYRAQRHRTRRI